VCVVSEHLVPVELCLLPLLPARKGNAAHSGRGSHFDHCLPNAAMALHHLTLALSVASPGFVFLFLPLLVGVVVIILQCLIE
jgi:hypothetical protein